MKKIQLFFGFASCAFSLYSAEKKSAFKAFATESIDSKTISRAEKLETLLNVLVVKAEEYKKSMRNFAKSQSDSTRFGKQETMALDHDFLAHQLKEDRDLYVKSVKNLLTTINHAEGFDRSVNDLIQELKMRPFSPESDDTVERFWEIRESVNNETKVYKTPEVIQPEPSGCSLQ